MPNRFEKFANVALVVSALAVSASVVRRDSQRSDIAVRRLPSEPPSELREWRSLASEAIRLGPENAAVQVLEFADLECPYCREFHKQIARLRQRYAGEVSLLFVHFPLDMHRFARPAARAVECARYQDRFESMVDAVYSSQDSLGLVQWKELAARAGVPDLAGFAACSERSESIPAVERGLALGRKLGVRATPTVVINGWQYANPPTGDHLDSLVAGVLRGLAPDRITREYFSGKDEQGRSP